MKRAWRPGAHWAARDNTNLQDVQNWSRQRHKTKRRLPSFLGFTLVFFSRIHKPFHVLHKSSGVPVLRLVWTGLVVAGVRPVAAEWQQTGPAASEGWVVAVHVLCSSDGWQHIRGGFWDPVLVRRGKVGVYDEEDELKEEEEGGAWTSTSWAGCFDPKSWSKPDWSLRPERRRRTPEEETRTHRALLSLLEE